MVLPLPDCRLPQAEKVSLLGFDLLEQALQRELSMHPVLEVWTLAGA